MSKVYRIAAQGMALASFLGLMTAALAAAELLPSPSTPKLGQPTSEAAIARIDLSVFPDGKGLPPGRGTAAVGEKLFAEKCQSCHGVGGRGASAEELVGDAQTPTAENPSKTIGAYWPYATTLFDFIRRTKPPGAPKTLSNDELYAVVAYLLAANKVIPADSVLDAKSLAQIRMPNRDGFTHIDAP